VNGNRPLRGAQCFQASLCGLEPVLWKVVIGVSCPKCTGDSDVGSLLGGGVVIRCRKCEWSTNLLGVDLATLQGEVLKEGARRIGEANPNEQQPE